MQSGSEDRLIYTCGQLSPAVQAVPPPANHARQPLLIAGQPRSTSATLHVLCSIKKSWGEDVNGRKTVHGEWWQRQQAAARGAAAACSCIA